MGFFWGLSTGMGIATPDFRIVEVDCFRCTHTYRFLIVHQIGYIFGLGEGFQKGLGLPPTNGSSWPWGLGDVVADMTHQFNECRGSSLADEGRISLHRAL